MEGLRRRIGPARCAEQPCAKAPARTERVLLPGGTEQAVGAPPPPLCSSCPTWEASRRPIRWVEVVRDLRNRHGGHEGAMSAATLPSVAPALASEGYGSPQSADGPTPPEPEEGDGLPAAWPADHPARLALEEREPPARRSRNPAAGSSISPEDFGL